MLTCILRHHILDGNSKRVNSIDMMVFIAHNDISDNYLGICCIYYWKNEETSHLTSSACLNVSWLTNMVMRIIRCTLSHHLGISDRICAWCFRAWAGIHPSVARHRSANHSPAQKEWIIVQNNYKIYVKRDFWQWQRPRQYHEADWM